MKQEKGKSDQALAYMAEHGINANVASKMFGISATAIYKRQKYLESRPVCPCCGQLIKPAKE